jgi:hypothetical protein
MLADLLINLGASIIYDFGKAVKNQTTKAETVQVVLKQLGRSHTLHDFPERYVEALVELRFQDKDKVVMAFFREESIAQAFYNYYYSADEAIKFNESILKESINHCVEALKVGDDVKNSKVDVGAEVKGFWEVFQQKIHESRSLKDVEIEKSLSEIKAGIAGVSTRKIPHALTKSPFQSDVFIGREADLITIKEKLFSNNKLLLVNGRGGVGKTTIAAKYYISQQESYKHVAWVLSEPNIAQALLTNLAAPLGLSFDPKATEAERFDTDNGQPGVTLLAGH